jgi:hypothetical protein
VRPVASLGAAALLAVLAPSLRAQAVSLRLGALRARYADSLSGSAGSVAGRLVLESARVRAAGEASVARFTSGSWAAQGGGSVLGLRAVGRRWSVGVLAEGDGAWLEGGTWSGTADAGPIVAVTAGPWMVTAVASAGAVRRVDGTSDPLLGSTLRLRRDVAAWSFDVSASGTSAGTVRFADFAVGVEGRAGALSGSLLASVRAGDLSGGPRLQASAAWRFAPAVALEGALGSYPEDVTGFTHGFFVTAGMRVGLSSSALGRLPRGGDRDFQLAAAGPSRVLLSVRVPGATSVAIAGEWNAWDGAPLRPLGGGRWEIELPLTPGSYRFALVTDGSRWMVPRGVPSMPDDFGGRVGLLIVRR